MAIARYIYKAVTCLHTQRCITYLVFQKMVLAWLHDSPLLLCVLEDSQLCSLEQRAAAGKVLDR